MHTPDELAYKNLTVLRTQFEDAAAFLEGVPLAQRVANRQDIETLWSLADAAETMTFNLEHGHMSRAHQGLKALRETVAARVAFFAGASRSSARCYQERGADQLLEFYTDVNQTLAKVALR